MNEQSRRDARSGAGGVSVSRRMQARQWQQLGRPLSRRSMMYEKVDQRAAIATKLSRLHLAGADSSGSDNDSMVDEESEHMDPAQNAQSISLRNSDPPASAGRSGAWTTPDATQDHDNTAVAELAEAPPDAESARKNSSDGTRRKYAPGVANPEVWESLRRSDGSACVPPVEGWASLRTQLQLARAEAEDAEEEVLMLRAQLSAAQQKETLNQQASKAMIKASRECSVEMRNLRHDKQRLERELSTLQTGQRVATGLQAERDSLAERLRETERCIRAGATDRVQLENEAAAAIARCERLEHAQDQVSEHRAARAAAEERATTLEHKVATLRNELNTAKRELQELRDGTAAAAALAQKQQWQATQHAANLALRRLSQQLLFRGFSGWSGAVCWLQRARKLCKQVVSRMQHRLQHVALSRWRAQVSSQRRHAAVLARCIQKLRLAPQARAFSAWRDDADQRQQSRSVLRRVIKRLHNNLLHRALSSWHDCFLIRRKQKLIVHRAVARMQNAVAYSAFSVWRNLVTRKRRAQGVVLKHLARMMHAVVYAAWSAWQNATSERRRMRSSCLRVISRIQNGLIHAAFSRWRAEAGRYRRLHLICKNIVLRLQNRQLATALTAWRLAVKQLVTEALVEKQRTEHASAQAAEGASAALRIAEARAAKLENELAESNREARHARLQYEEITARLVEANRARDAATELYEQLSNMETRTEELETIRYANQELQLSVSTVLHSLETERLQSEVLAVCLISAKAEKVAACEKVKKLERRLQRALDATPPNLHSALWSHGSLPGRSSSFGGVPTGRLPGPTRRSDVNARMLEHGVPSNNEEARRSMTRPSFDWRAKTVSSVPFATEQVASKHVDRAVSPREQRAREAEDKRVAAAEAEVERAKQRLRTRTGSADTTVSVAFAHLLSPPPSQPRGGGRLSLGDNAGTEVYSQR